MQAPRMLPPHKPASQHIYEAIRNAIILCELEPGARLSEHDIAKQFGVSRQPVREACIKLSQEGLINVLPQRGTFVGRISSKRVSDGRFIREAIEIAVAKKAALEITTRQLIVLKDNLSEQRQEVERGNRARFIELDDVFHQALAQSVDCIDAWQILQTIKANMDRVRYLSLFEESPLPVLLRQHQAIFDAIKSSNPEQAKLAIQEHLKELDFSFASLSVRNNEWFES